MAHEWEMFPGAVAVIDGTRHEIKKPQTEPQQQFYSGHCHYHNSAKLQMMLRIGNGEEFHLPAGLYILADNGYTCKYSLLTPWQVQQVAGNQRRECFNLELRRARVKVQHCIRGMKEYGPVSHCWSREGWVFSIVNELCAFLTQKDINLSHVL